MRDGWELSEERMPESVIHDRAVELLKALLSAWASRAAGEGATPAFVARNLAVRWDASRPAVGVDPDVSVFCPAPPGADALRSVRTWLPGHTAPILAIEVVSDSDPHKDYVVAPDKYAACGAQELWIFDPLLAGPQAHGGPHRLQIWRRSDEGGLTRVYAGDGPARSDVLGAFVVPTADGRELRVADDADATHLWRTPEETERLAAEIERHATDAERARAEVERQAKEAALARVAELEAALAARRG